MTLSERVGISIQLAFCWTWACESLLISYQKKVRQSGGSKSKTTRSPEACSRLGLCMLTLSSNHKFVSPWSPEPNHQN